MTISGICCTTVTELLREIITRKFSQVIKMNFKLVISCVIMYVLEVAVFCNF